ncbi:MAG: bifunctional nuclease family protein [Candidatus Desulforudis sp.]|nr:bifunctional nuclease family protein [Desulforudis sp.]
MIPVKVKEIAFDLSMNPVLLLVDEAEVKALPIWIGQFEAHAIALALEGGSAPRPLTHDLLKTMCDEFGGAITKVVINDVHDGTYYAQLHVLKKDCESILDARPSDAVALALRSVAPIFITQKVADYTLAVEELFNEERQEALRQILEDHQKTIKKSLH